MNYFLYSMLEMRGWCIKIIHIYGISPLFIKWEGFLLVIDGIRKVGDVEIMRIVHIFVDVVCVMKEKCGLDC